MNPTGECTVFTTKKLAPETIQKARREIYHSFREYSNQVWRMTAKCVEKIFRMYDQLCLDGKLFRYLQEKGYSIDFKIEGRDQFTTDGVCMLGSCRYLITLPMEKFKGVTGPKTVAGQSCKDQLECLLRVVEHEMIHLILFVFCWDVKLSNEHAEMFTKMAQNLFGHTDVYHYIF